MDCVEYERCFAEEREEENSGDGDGKYHGEDDGSVAGDYGGELEDDRETLKEEEEEQRELSFLRVENALLKKKIQAYERLGQGDKRSGKVVVNQSEMDRINELLQKAADAKSEAINYVANTSRDKLGHDIRVLQAILKKAKAERHAFKKTIKAAEEKLAMERQKNEDETLRFQVDREIFAKILQDDREASRNEVNLLIGKMTQLQQEKHALFLWTKEQHERHLHEIRKLTRALGRTKKMADEHKRTSEDVLHDVRDVQATVFPDAGSRCRPSSLPITPPRPTPPSLAFDLSNAEPVTLATA